MSGERWETLHVGAADGNIHVLPIDDLREHEERTTCWCKPRIEEERQPRGKVKIVVHAAHDGRELVERHGLQ